MPQLRRRAERVPGGRALAGVFVSFGHRQVRGVHSGAAACTGPLRLARQQPSRRLGLALVQEVPAGGEEDERDQHRPQIACDGNGR